MRPPALPDASLRSPTSPNDGYVFDPQSFGPHCKAVKLVLFSEKEPNKQDTRVIDPRLIERIWQDFAAYRALVAATSDSRP